MKRAIFAIVAACTAAAALAAPGAVADAAASNPPVAVYDATPSVPLPGNVPSYAFEATQTNELGSEVTLAGTARTLANVTVTMSSWACQHGTWNANNCATEPGAKFTEPVTLTVYAASHQSDDGTVTPGRVLTRSTQTFSMPYRPVANLRKCNSSNGNTGKWYSTADGKCYNGKAFNITFNFRSLKLKLPDDVVLGVAFNTSDQGPAPYGTQACNSTDAGCAYDALNVGSTNEPTVGTDTVEDTAFINTDSAGNLCDGTPAVGVFNLDSPTTACYGGAIPAIKVTATN